MADSLSTIGSIATFVVQSFNNLSDFVSGNMVQTVDINRQKVASWTGQTIGSNSIADQFQPAIVNFSMGMAVRQVQGQAGKGQGTIKLAELSISEGGEVMTAAEYDKMGELCLGAIGRKSRFARSLS